MPASGSCAVAVGCAAGPSPPAAGAASASERGARAAASTLRPVRRGRDVREPVSVQGLCPVRHVEGAQPTGSGAGPAGAAALACPAAALEVS